MGAALKTTAARCQREQKIPDRTASRLGAAARPRPRPNDHPKAVGTDATMPIISPSNWAPIRIRTSFRPTSGWLSRGKTRTTFLPLLANITEALS